VAECVETKAEVEILLDAGITLMQGYLFAKPTFERLPEITWPDQSAKSHPLKLELAPNDLPSVA
jgi:EAL domain-containing protein (putative c-di-GMP-specific phosphodiesterase class I)